MLKYLAISIIINFCFSVVTRKSGLRNKLLLALPVIVNVLLLLYLKYFGFAITNFNTFMGLNISHPEISYCRSVFPSILFSR